MAAAGFKPADITDVFISHAHPDHIGGLVNKNYSLIYSNADYYLSKTEYDFWVKANINDFKNSGLFKQAKVLETLIPAIRKVLDTIKPKLKFYNNEVSLYENFSFIAPGHTPGMTLTKIKADNEELLVVADLIHSDILLFPHPEWGLYGDTDLDVAISSRIKILDLLSSSKMKMIGYHLPWCGIGYVKKIRNTYQWIQEVSYKP